MEEVDEWVSDNYSGNTLFEDWWELAELDQR